MLHFLNIFLAPAALEQSSHHMPYFSISNWCLSMRLAPLRVRSIPQWIFPLLEMARTPPLFWQLLLCLGRLILIDLIFLTFIPFQSYFASFQNAQLLHTAALINIAPLIPTTMFFRT